LLVTVNIPFAPFNGTGEGGLTGGGDVVTGGGVTVGAEAGPVIS